LIEDEMGPASVSDDIRSQSAQRMPREFHVGPWIVIAVIIGLLILFL
jgi:hypothetical protein